MVKFVTVILIEIVLWSLGLGFSLFSLIVTSQCAKFPVL